MFSESVLDHKGKFDGRLERGVFWRGNFNRRNVSYTTFVRLTSKLALSTGMDLFRNGCTKSVGPYCCVLQESDLIMAVSQNITSCVIVGFRFERKKTPMMSEMLCTLVAQSVAHSPLILSLNTLSKDTNSAGVKLLLVVFNFIRCKWALYIIPPPISAQNKAMLAGYQCQKLT